MERFEQNKADQNPYLYKVKRLTSPLTIDADWNKPLWQTQQPLDIKLFMGEKPLHLPKAQAKLLYDDQNIYVIFRVNDQYVRATAKKNFDPVWQDSCVEFFFTPGTDISQGYFNLESNCGGTMLLCHQTAREQNRVSLDLADLEQIEIAHSLDKIIDPEITEPVTWTLEHRLPVKIIEKYAPAVTPAPGVTWRANFYKCGDNTSHPHWLTWSPIENPTPDFHLPRFFGTLEFA